VGGGLGLIGFVFLGRVGVVVFCNPLEYKRLR